MNLLIWALFGVIAGVVAHFLDPLPAKGGLLGAIAFGLIGALGGGIVSSVVFGIGFSGFDLLLFIIAAAGAFLLLLVQRSFFTNKFTT